MPSQQQPTKRRFLMPIAIVIAAAAIALWGWDAKSQRENDIKEYVFLICEDVANGRDPKPRLRQTNPVIAKSTVDLLKVICLELPADLTGLEIIVQSGDSAEYGDGSATHTAMIRSNGNDKLGLRIVHQSLSDNIEIIGRWLPR